MKDESKNHGVMSFVKTTAITLCAIYLLSEAGSTTYWAIKCEADKGRREDQWVSLCRTLRSVGGADYLLEISGRYSDESYTLRNIQYDIDKIKTYTLPSIQSDLDNIESDVSEIKYR